MYLSKVVKIDINNGYYYCGKVVAVDDRFLDLIDKNDKHVTISINDILNVREVS